MKAWISRVASRSNIVVRPNESDFGLVEIGVCHNRSVMADDRIRGSVTPQLSGALAGRGWIVPNAL